MPPKPFAKSFDRRAIPAGAAFRSWAAPDGWPYRILDWPQGLGGEAATGKARGSLLFAGGRGDFIEKYLEAEAHWHDRGWDVTAFDWRGQGGSRGDLVGGHVDSFDRMVDDLTALIAEWHCMQVFAATNVMLSPGSGLGWHILHCSFSVPASGRMRPKSMRRKVVLPAPLGPRTP